MATLRKTFELDAGHRLSKHDFKCQNLHGHRYQFEVEVEGERHPETGMIVDFANLKSPVMDTFDHNFLLNEDDPILEARSVLEANQEKSLYLMDGEPTVENIAEEALQIIEDALTDDEQQRVQQLRLTVYETPTSSVIKKRSL